MKNTQKVLTYISKLKWRIFLVIGLICGSTLLAQLPPIFSKFIVDELVKVVNDGEGNLQLIIWLLVGSFVVAIVSNIITSVSNRNGDYISGRARQILTNKFYNKVLSLPQKYFDSQVSGQIQSQFSRGIESIKGLISLVTNFAIPTFLQSILAIAIMAYFNIYVALLFSLLFPIYFFLTRASTKQWGKYEEEKNSIEDVTRSRITEVLQNIRLVKTFTTEYLETKTTDENLTKSNEIYDKQSGSFHLIDFLRNASLTVIVFCSTLIIFYFTYTKDLSIGDMTLLLQLLILGQRPLFAMSFIMTQFQTAESGAKEFMEIMALESTEVIDKSEKVKAKTKKGEKLPAPTIEFDKVSFAYEESDTVLSNVSLKLEPGETVALVGHSGAGKSTLINLILKLYEPTKGEIKLCDYNYSEISHTKVRENISLVLQDNELFSTTIRENVAYGQGDISEEELIKALKTANAWKFVSEFENGLDTEIGERGLKLSGGQKQRIQLARAILKDSPIVILDEATSNLDAASEAKVYKALENIIKDKLVIIIAHRFSTIQTADKVIVLNKGKIEDIGAPQKLAKGDGTYAKLLQYQIDGNKKLLENYELY